MTIPQLRVPFVFVEFDSSRAVQGPSILAYQTLMIGQRLSSGTKPEKQVDLVTSADQAGDFYGKGSQLHRMAEFYFNGNKVTKTFFASLDDLVAGVLATGTVTFTGPATKDGSVIIYIGGRRIVVGVTDGDSETIVAAAVVTAVTALTISPVTAGNVAGVVTFTSKHKGEAGNDIDIRLNYNDGEVLPIGITAVIVGMASGAGNPLIQGIIDILGEEQYNIIIAPYNDAVNLTAIETELVDRFGPIRQNDGVYVTSKRGTVGTLVTFGTGRNSPHVTIMHSEKILNLLEEFSASYGAQLALEGQADPARPFQTLALSGITPPSSVEEFTILENDQLLNSGIATFQVDRGGIVRIQRAITMFQTNAASAPSTAFLDVNTLLTLMFLRFDFRTTILNKYPRAKLADDGILIPVDQSIITPKIGRAEAVAIFRNWESIGLVENIDQFKNDLVVVRNVSDPNRLDFLIPPDLINQFRVGAATIQFLLSQPV